MSGSPFWCVSRDTTATSGRLGCCCAAPACSRCCAAEGAAAVSARPWYSPCTRSAPALLWPLLLLPLPPEV